MLHLKFIEVYALLFVFMWLSANKYFFTSYKPQTYRYTPALGILNFTQEFYNELNREKSVRWDAASVAPPAAAFGAFRSLPLHLKEVPKESE